MENHTIKSNSQHKPKTANSFECEICKSCFTLKGNLKKHQKKVHYGIKIMRKIKEKKYECNTCHLKFDCRGNLNKHEVIHTSEKLFKCETCEKTFRTACNLKAHKRKTLVKNHHI